MSRHQPIVAVMYDKGAVSPGEIGLGLTDLGRVIFLVHANAHLDQVRVVMEKLGQVVLLNGTPQGDADLVRRLAPDAVLTFSEPMLRATADLAAVLGLPFHDVETARTLTDKVRQRQVLREAGVDDVRHHPLRSVKDWPDALASVGLPAIVKPVSGGGSRETYAVTSDAQARRLLPRIFDSWERSPISGPLLVVEELLAGEPSLPFGDYVSVESICTPRGVAHLALTGRLPLATPFRETGNFWPSHLPRTEQEAVLDLASRALGALGVTYGLTHTEIKLTAAGPRIIEVNGRLGGHMNHLAHAACGVDLVRIAGLLALGQPVDVTQLRPDKVHFQYYVPAPTQPCCLEAVHGDREVRRLPGISGYRSLVRVGEELPGGVMTREMDEIWGVGDNHFHMIDLLEQALAIISYDFRFPGGVRRVSAAALRN